jgi:L-alanine-DL-glutamate epimerase-like enolase superfamily enzyme
MMVDSISVRELRIPFKLVFAHASAKRAATQTILVVARARDGSIGHGEGCPREYVTGEDLATAQDFVAKHFEEWRHSIHDTASLLAWVDAHRSEIDRQPSAWAAVELALLDLIGHAEGSALESVLGLPKLAGSFRYTAVLGDARSEAFEAQLAAYLRAGFADFKIKLAGDASRDRAKVRALRAAGIAPQAVRADANNLWTDAAQAIAYLDRLDFSFWALEEPLKAGDYTGMRRVSDALRTKIVLDESMLRVDQLDAMNQDPSCWIVNVRVSKMGGLLRSLKFAHEARRYGARLIVGAHVGETSILTRAALAVAHGFRDCVLAQEGAFGTYLLERDVVEPALQFGRGGMLDTAPLDIAGAPGLGLDINLGFQVHFATPARNPNT